MICDNCDGKGYNVSFSEKGGSSVCDVCWGEGEIEVPEEEDSWEDE